MSGEGNSSSVQLDYLFGISEQSAVGFRTGYGTSDSSSTSVSGNVTQSRYVGMNDLYFKYESFRKMNSFKVNYGISCGLSPDKARSSSSTSDGNNWSGGTSFIPFVAIEMGEENLHYGLGFSSTLRMTRKLEQASSNPGTSEVTGGNSVSWTPYFEIQMGSGLFVGQIILGSLDKSKTTTSTGTTSESNSSESKTALIAYAYDFHSSFRLIGEFAYVAWAIPASGIVDSANISFMTYGLSGRFGF